MPTSTVFNNISYPIPIVGDTRWGQAVTNFLLAVGNNALSKAGGNFSLTADVNFGANYGVIAKYLKSGSTNIAQSGVIRFANNEGFGFRSADNLSDLILKVNASDQLEFNGSAFASSGDVSALATRVTAAEGTISGHTSQIAANTIAIGNKQDSSTAVTLTGAQSISDKTLVAPIFSVETTFTEISSPISPAAGLLKVFAKDGKLWTKNSAGVETQVGSGSGSGVIDYWTNGDFEATPVNTTPAGWTFYTGAGAVPSTSSVTTDGSPTMTFRGTSAGALRGTMGAVLVKPTTNQQGKGIYFDFTIKDIDKNKSFILNFDYLTAVFATGDFKVYLWDRTSNTQIPLSISDMGLGYGTLRANCYLTNSLIYRLMIHCAVTSTLAATITLDGGTFSPGVTAYGGGPGPWTSYPATVTGLIDNTGTIRGYYRTNGENIDVRIDFVKSATAGSGTGNALFTLPSGYTVDALALGPPGNPIIGSAGTYSVEALNVFNESQVIAPSASYLAIANTGSADYYRGADFRASSWTNLVASIPVNELRGQNTLPLSNTSGIEYASSSTGTWDQAAAASNTVIGPDGSLITGALTSDRIKTVRFLTPLQQGDVLTLQYRASATSAWVDQDVSARPFFSLPGIAFGAFIQATVAGGTDVSIFFNRYSLSGTTYNSAVGATDWAASPTYAWRLKKTSAALVAGIQTASKDGPGLLKFYEEGTFTPSFGGSTTDPTVSTYTVREGTFTRMGNIVHFQIHLTLGTMGAAGSGNALVRGLPYIPNSSDYQTVTIGYSNGWSNAGPTNALILPGISVIQLYSRLVTAPFVNNAISTSNLANGADVYIGGSYRI